MHADPNLESETGSDLLLEECSVGGGPSYPPSWGHVVSSRAVPTSTVFSDLMREFEVNVG